MIRIIAKKETTISQFQLGSLGARLKNVRELYFISWILIAASISASTCLCLDLKIYAPAGQTIPLLSVLSVIVSNLNFAVLMSCFIVCLLGLRSRLLAFNECFEYGERTERGVDKVNPIPQIYLSIHILTPPTAPQLNLFVGVCLFVQIFAGNISGPVRVGANSD